MSLVTEFNTRLHACSIETLYHSKSPYSVFVCGTYELNEESKTRAGAIVLFEYQDGALKVISERLCDSGVLDMKISHNMLGAAMSTGKLDLFSINASDAVTLSSVCSIENEDEGLFLSLDFDNRLADNQSTLSGGDKIAVSTQSGSAILYKFSEGGLVEDLHLPNIHSLFGESMPVWITAFNCHHRQTLLTGGDDCKFRLWDLRCADTSGGCPSGLIHTNKSHSAGVTSAQWHPIRENLFVTGSYDESVSIWDERRMSQPLLHIPTGGGVWRAKWSSSHFSGSEFLVTASMQGGSRVYQLKSTRDSNVDDSSTSFSYSLAGSIEQRDERNDKHLAYGIDVLKTIHTAESGSEEELTLASCSFYDNLVQVWSASMSQ